MFGQVIENGHQTMIDGYSGGSLLSQFSHYHVAHSYISCFLFTCLVSFFSERRKTFSIDQWQ